MDGVCILVGGVVLFTLGFITDTLGPIIAPGHKKNVQAILLSFIQTLDQQRERHYIQIEKTHCQVMISGFTGEVQNAG